MVWRGYLKKLVDNGTTVVVYLMNGFQLHGVITEFDDDSIVVKTLPGEQMNLVFRHAISTIKEM